MSRSRILAERNSTPERFDLTFVLLVCAMCGLGLVTLFSASLHYADRVFNDPFYFVRRQAINMLVSIIALVISACFNLDLIRKFLPKLVILTAVLCVLPFMPVIGITKNGASRWFGIGSFTFQPSELVKMMIVVYLAHYFTKPQNELLSSETLPPVIPPAILSGFFVSLVYIQNDFSTSFFIISIALTMFFLANVGIIWFMRLLAVAIPLSFFMIFTSHYRLQRIIAFLKPDLDPLGAGYQVNASLAALREGGFWGRGLGNGIRKISSIPEVQSDFIYAVWGEEMGFVGVLLYFTVLGFFAWQGYKISLACRDRYRSLLGFGSVSIILYQSLMNCAVVARVVPATGIPLPFFSSGGSSLLITLSLCGLIINVSRWNSQREIQNV